MADAHDPFPSCDVCGRTMLKGEQLHDYLTPQRERIRVCVLCRSRAESSGWIPVSMAHTMEGDEQPKRSRGLGLRQRLSRAASRARSSTSRSRREPEPADFERAWEEPASEPGPREPEPQPIPADAQVPPEPPRTEAPAEAEEAPRQPEPPQPPEKPEVAKPRRAAKPRARRPQRTTAAQRAGKPATKAAKPARKSPAKRGPEALMRRAVERFNSSEERRKVAGLIRSLGEPQAGVRPDPRRQLAVVTVGWELSWYQWEVGAHGDGEDAEPVREVAKGAELSELSDEVRSWNALVDEDGTLRLRSAAERPKQETTQEA